MLRLVGSNYYFRRAVPMNLCSWLGRGEVSHSLKTSNKLAARQQAALFYARTGQCFQEIRRMTTEPSAKTLSAADIIRFYEQFVKDLENYHTVCIDELTMRHKSESPEQTLREAEFLHTVMRFLDVIGQHFEHTDDFLRELRQQNAVNQAVTRTRESMLREEISGLRKMVVEIKGILPQERRPDPGADESEALLPRSTLSPKKQRLASSQTISAMVQRFILNDASKSADTFKGTRTTVDLFVEAFGDLPVTQIAGTTAGDFKDLLLGLPATHGKAKKCLPIRDAVKVAKEQGLKTLSGKTAKNHFSRLSALWAILVQREIVPRNPWMKWSFDTTKETDRRCWTDEELALLSEAQWEHRGISRRTYAGMVNVALYTGLRLGEICNLRSQDIENVQGVACFQIRPHPEED